MPKSENPICETSVIVPCFNEEKTICKLLEAIYRQSYPRELLEVIISDAQSEDLTREKISKFSKENPDLEIRIIDNSERTIPAAVNRAVESARGIYIVRLDAHSVPDENYIAYSIQLLKEKKAENVGGVWVIAPGNDSCMALAIARAAGHPIGAGDAKYRISNKAGYVETVPFGAFKKETFLRIGKFNEQMLANEDYEFNTRIRMQDGKIWFDPKIRSIYYARSTLKDLAKQYWRYGYWKFQMLKKYPGSIRWRQVLPPFFVLIIIILSVFSLFLLIPRIILALLIGIYYLALIVSSTLEAARSQKLCFLNMIFAFNCMHFCWGSGFFFSILKGPKK
jgi:succinoglycan biosynthesis protein ExoA